MVCQVLMVCQGQHAPNKDSIPPGARKARAQIGPVLRVQVGFFQEFQAKSIKS